VGGQHECFQVRLHLLEPDQQVDAAQVRKVEIEQGDVEAAALGTLERFLGRAGSGDACSLALELARHHLTQLFVVVYNQQLQRRAGRSGHTSYSAYERLGAASLALCAAGRTNANARRTRFIPTRYPDPSRVADARSGQSDLAHRTKLADYAKQWVL